MQTIILSGKQLKEALEFVNPDGENDPDQLETEVTFQYLSGTQTPRDEKTQDNLPSGIYLYMTDYPEEGWLGPLGVDMVPGKN